MKASFLFPGVLAAFLAGCVQTPTTPAPAPAAPTGAAAPKAVDGAFDDDAHPLTPVESAVIAAGKDRARLAALEQQLLATVLQPGADRLAAQEAAHHLGFVMQSGPAGPNPATLKALAPLLTDPVRADFARLALDRVPGPAIYALYLEALPHAAGRERVGIINSLGVRQVAAAVPLLAGLLAGDDAPAASAAAAALGRIGGPAALSALESAPQPRDPVVLNARLDAARKAGSEALARTAGTIFGGTDAPLPQRAAALRALIDAKPDRAVAEIDDALKGNVRALQAVAIQSVVSLPAGDAAAQLAGRLSEYPAEMQIELLAALGNRGDAGAVPGALKALQGSDESVRLAAIDALGRLPGSVEVARALAPVAAGSGPEAKAAFASLARLNGPGIDDLVRSSAAAGDDRLRALFIQQIAARNLTDALPFLLSLRESPVEALRLEALDALRLIAGTAEEDALISWTLAAPAKSAEQTRANRALVTTILRNDDPVARTDRVVAALDRADTAGRLTLLPVLSRTGGPNALTALQTLAVGPVEAEAAAAAAELGRWPDFSALAVAANTAGRTGFPSVRNAAVRSAVALYSRMNRAPNAAETELACRLAAVPLEHVDKQALLGVLSLCATPAALAAAEHFVTDAAVTEYARDAVDAISSNLAGPPVWTATADAGNLGNLSDGKPETHWMGQNTPDQWIMADLHRSRPVRKVILDSSDHRGWGYPAHVEICVSDDPAQPGPARAELDGERVLNIVQLPAGVRGRYVWIKQTGKRDAPWSIGELVIQ